MVVRLNIGHEMCDISQPVLLGTSLEKAHSNTAVNFYFTAYHGFDNKASFSTPTIMDSTAECLIA